jgi:hypothetical protein
MKKAVLILIALVLSLFTLPDSPFAGPYDVPAKIPDTGQTKCYDTAGNEIACPSPGQEYHGQDANYAINPMSFTAQPDGTVKDNVTGLIWEVKQNKDGVKDYANPNDADNTYTWYDPDPGTNGGYAGTQSANDTQDFLAALRAKTGYSDWRLPSREELRSIVDYSIPYPGPTINTGYFPNTVSSVYWSSSPDAYYTDYAWGVYFDDGGDNSYGKPWSGYVRAVRGGQ